MPSSRNVLVVENDLSRPPSSPGDSEISLALRRGDALAVEICASPREAMDRMARKRPDLVVTEWEFEGGDARELLAGAGLAAVPVVVLSTSSDARVASEAFRAGARDFLPRDSRQIERLADIVLGIIDQQHALQAAQLHGVTDRFAVITATVSDHMAFVSPDYIILSANAAVWKAYERPSNEQAPVPVAELMGKEVFQHLIQPRMDSCLRGQRVRYQAWFEYPTLGRRYMDVRYHPYREADGPVSGIVVSARDITESIRAEEERLRIERHLQQTQKMEAVGTLASGAAHDFNNIITAVLGYVDMARNQVARPEAVLAALDEIESAAAQATSLTSSLLTFSRPSDAMMRRLDLSALVRDSVRMLRRILPARIEVEEDIEESLFVRGDATLLNQMLMNLAINSRDAMPEGGRLQVRLRTRPVGAERNGAQLELTDEGIGMTDDVKSRVFDPFFTTKRRGQGAGLGMSVVHGIVREHQGHVEIESRVRQGTCIRIQLPLEEPVEASARAPRVRSGRGEKLILAEDNRQVRAILASALMVAGYNALQAEDGEVAESLFREQYEDVGLVILDIDLPKKNGIDCLYALREIQPDLPAIVMSGLGKVRLEKPLPENVVVLTKPFVMSDLVTAVQRCLKRGAGG